MNFEDLGYSSSIIDSIEPFVKSVTLVGSYVVNETVSDSDIDLIIIGTPSNKIRKLMLKTNLHTTGNNRPRIDLKILTQQDFLIKKSKMENFFFWTCSQNRRVLYGVDILEKLELNCQSVDNLIWYHVERLQESLEWLERESRYSGSCYYIYEYLTTSYFLERFVFESKKGKSQKKSEYIESNLDHQYEIIKQKNYAVLKKESSFGISGVTKIRHEIDKAMSTDDYYELQLINEKVLSDAEDTKKRFGNWLNSYDMN